jgi:site-specific DNA-methyltransferase (adenine-specific)
MNQLYYGDNLEILRRHIKDQTVDLVYLDPPFQSGRDYNVLFERQDTTKAAAQIRAFGDTWQWSIDAESAYREIVQRGGELSKRMQAFRQLLDQSNMMAYLCMMAPRLIELKRVLKPTGSIYLHCDQTASHYLKLLMDAVFSARMIQNEIIWQRTTAKALATKRLPNNHDTILAYRSGESAQWNMDAAYIQYDPENLEEKTLKKYSHVDEEGRRYTLENLMNPNPDRPNLRYEFLGHLKVWRWTKERMLEAYRKGLVIQPSPGAVPRAKQFLDERKGRPLGDVWSDIPPLNSQAAERLGFPTQKPLALLERIIQLATNPGDTVLDPFCGCGTAVHAAQQLERRWIGIDITCLATNLIKSRMMDAFNLKVVTKGEPTSLAEAKNLASEDRFQFQCWALGFVGARSEETKKGADKGIDGRLYFHAEPTSGATQQAIFSVKSGKLKAPDLRDLRGVIDREEAEIGALITLEEPSKPMRAEAASAGFYESPWGKHPRLQILTIAELLGGARLNYPPSVPFQKAANDLTRATGTAGPSVVKAKLPAKKKKAARREG